jgi:bifunctional DNA-binding transcriptional regulator/antitoxin component of YhaV-PrlF toxin-antitoxin module
MNTELILKRMLFNAGKIAIPLKVQEGLNINPQPNFLIIDNIFDYVVDKFPTNEGELIETECQKCNTKLVYREILLREYGRLEEIREVLSDDTGTLSIPEDYVYILKNHQRLIDNESVVNNLLSLFNFRGYLKGFKLEYDVEKSKEYLQILEYIKNGITEIPIAVEFIQPDNKEVEIKIY